VKGKFELADGGSLFLDEIADMSPSAQAKILRAVETGEFERLGSERFAARTSGSFGHPSAAREPGPENRFRRDLFFGSRDHTADSALRESNPISAARRQGILTAAETRQEDSGARKERGRSSSQPFVAGEPPRLDRVIDLAVTLTRGFIRRIDLVGGMPAEPRPATGRSALRLRAESAFAVGRSPSREKVLSTSAEQRKAAERSASAIHARSEALLRGERPARRNLRGGKKAKGSSVREEPCR